MLTPIGKRLIIQPCEITPNHKIIVTNQKPKSFKVIAIGDEVTKVKPDNIIYLDKYAGTEIEHEDDKFMVIDESSILAKVD
jgi:co-chaperonin GroES (HSP10)